MPSSILIFELNRKFLLYKILTDELTQILKDEIVKNFGSNYVAEKQKQQQEHQQQNDDTSTTERENSISEETPPTNDEKFELTNDLIYEFFSPIVASFEITKDINYVFEYALFKKTNHIIRFNIYNNCLIMCILKSTPYDSDMAKLIYLDYYSSWYSKSIISLLKYKYGICSDEKCFSSGIDLKKLYQKWSYLYVNDQVYYIEAIEQLQVNEDIKIKCETFLNELVQFLIKTETIMSEFDYIDESYENLRPNEDEDDDLSNSDNILFQSDEVISESVSFTQRFRCTELESFFSDLTQINQFILTCGSKLLYKFKLDSSDKSSFSIDSSSLFMLILEAATFLDYNVTNPFNEDENEAFKSVSNSPVAKSVTDSVESDKQIRPATSHSDNPVSMNSLFDNFQSVYSIPSIINMKLSESSTDNLEIKHDEIDLDSKGRTKFKKTNCFLKTNNNKSLGYYEIVLLKLSDNLCLTMIKSNKLTKYCELISDFDNLLVGLNDLLNRKRLQLSSNETNSSQQVTNDSDFKSNPKRSQQHLDKIDKAFFSFFMNKLIYFFDKLKQLKTDLNSSKETNKEKNSLLNFKFRSRKESMARQTTQRSSKDEIMKLNSIKLIHTLQFKLTQLTTRNEFKQFVTFINDENDSVVDSNEMLSNMRNIESQISAIRSNTTDLFYELFLARSTYLTDEIESYDKLAKNLIQDSESKRSSSTSTTNTILFKSAYLVDSVKEMYRKHIYDYIPFIEVKWTRNTSMLFFCNLYPGLIHFSFINRQDNTGVIPTVDTNEKFNMDELKINLAYKKYVPIIFTFFTKYQSTQFMFHDDKLQIVFSYIIWFEDKKANQLPIDFSAPNLINNDYLMQNSKISRGLFEQSNSNSSNNLTVAVDKTNNQLVNSPGITNKNNYDVLQSICYPNAPMNSLTCYELYSIHSPLLDEEKIKFQIKSLMNSLSKRTKNGSFEVY